MQNLYACTWHASVFLELKCFLQRVFVCEKQCSYRFVDKVQESVRALCGLCSWCTLLYLEQWILCLYAHSYMWMLSPYTGSVFVRYTCSVHGLYTHMRTRKYFCLQACKHSMCASTFLVCGLTTSIAWPEFHEWLFRIVEEVKCVTTHSDVCILCLYGHTFLQELV